MRDSLTLLDRLQSGLGQTISEADANAVLDLVDRRVREEILTPVLAQDAAGALAAVRSAIDSGVDPSRLSVALLSDLRDLRQEMKAEARISKELAGLDTKQSEAEFLEYARTNVASSG